MKFLCWLQGHKVSQETRTTTPYSDKGNGHHVYHGECDKCNKAVSRIFVWCPIGVSGSDWEIDKYPKDAVLKTREETNNA
jgi:hypothetical protein